MTEPAMRPTLSAELSRTLVDAAVAEARTMSVRVTVVAVDESGVLKEMLRMDGAPLVSVQTAINKAYSAAAIGMPPDDFFAAIQSDGVTISRSVIAAPGEFRAGNSRGSDAQKIWRVRKNWAG